MAVVTVMDLRTGETQDFTCTPQEAVIAAYAQGEYRDFNTWDYEKRYSHLLEHGKHVVLRGLRGLRVGVPPARFSGLEKGGAMCLTISPNRG